MKRGRTRARRATYCHHARRAKIRYKTLKDAKWAKRARLDQGEEYLRIYICPKCKGYHLSSNRVNENDPRPAQFR